MLKVVAGRPRDLEDVAGVLVRNPALDAAYVRRWLAAFEEAVERPLVVVFDQTVREAAP